MRLILVQPPSGRLDLHELAPPLGLLRLAAVAEDDGIDVEIADYNLRGMRDPAWIDGDFYASAAAELAARGPDVVGFTSMALESHVCLELARRLKGLDPGVVVVLGGPHFSSIAVEVLALYPWIDYVVCGEGELALGALLARLRRGKAPGEIANVAYRETNGTRLDRRFKPIGDLDELPFPAYHLIDLEAYFALNPNRVLDFDHARGCALRCAFCYSPVHWGQGEQTRRVDRIVADVARHRELGARHLFFVSDNFVNSKRFAARVAAAMREADLGLTWNCYATLAQLEPDLVDALAGAGCRGLFVGVDAVTDEAKDRFRKRYFRGWTRLASTLRGCVERGADPTCAFLVDLPSGADHARTDRCLETALGAASLGCGVRLNTLAVYNGTALDATGAARAARYSDYKARIIFDTHPLVHENPYARARPDLFPLHQRPIAAPAYERFLSVLHVAFTLFHRVPRTLVRYREDEVGSLWRLLGRVCDRVGDIAAIPTEHRREREVEAFAEVLARMPRARTVRGAFELEQAERALALDGGEPRPTVCAAGTRRRYRVAAHRILELTAHPADFERDGSMRGERAPARTYLLVRDRDRIRYFEAHPAVHGIVERIDAAVARGAPVRLPPSLLGELRSAGLLGAPRRSRATA